MEDMLKQELELGDVVAHVYPNSNGKTSALIGKITKFNKRGCQIITETNNIYNVKNVIKLNHKKVIQNVVNKTLEQNITLFDYVIGKVTKQI